MENANQISLMPSSGMLSKVSAALLHMIYDLEAIYCLPYLIFVPRHWLGFETKELSNAFHVSLVLVLRPIYQLGLWPLAN
jgi:hypothetical protein